ncbi:uncharacterized protein FA14DRAFT_179562 [Meira miltonrushii]|uniref:ALMS motif domain-containing protein n=1 Tax=Meira miltonrushii TaxID=1280837 RepID=A0A316VF44_9BASI|nr:uncharacterized protein FA14DRAFT_179562 [Meira miltonrushii]PWN36202.1 hypothetical protein FA14DRAFT_179562 [Meira miltonrushii]
MLRDSIVLLLFNALPFPDQASWYRSDDEYGLSSILLDSPSPRFGPSLTDSHRISAPSNEVHFQTESIHAVAPLESNNSIANGGLGIATAIQTGKPKRKRKLSEKARQQDSFKQRLRRQKIKEQGGEVEEAMKARQRGYNRKTRLKVLQDPAKLAEFRAYHRKASKMQYQRMKSDPVAFEAFKKRKSERQRIKRMQTSRSARNSPRYGTGITDADPFSAPSNEVHFPTESIHTAPSLEYNHLVTRESQNIATNLPSNEPKRTSIAKKKPSEEARQRKLLKQRTKRQQIKDEGGEVLEAFRVRQRGYDKTSRVKLRQDPIKLDKFRKYHRIASQRTYQRRRNDPVAFAAFKKMKTERSLKRRQKLKSKSETYNENSETSNSFPWAETTPASQPVPTPSNQVLEPVEKGSVSTTPLLKDKSRATQSSPSTEKVSPRRSEASREKKRLQQRVKRQRIRDQGEEADQAYRARQHAYSQKFWTKVREDPVKNKEYKNRVRLASQRAYQKKKEEDPIAFAKFVKMKSEKSYIRKKRLKTEVKASRTTDLDLELRLGPSQNQADETGTVNMDTNIPKSPQQPQFPTEKNDRRKKGRKIQRPRIPLVRSSEQKQNTIPLTAKEMLEQKRKEDSLLKRRLKRHHDKLMGKQPTEMQKQSHKETGSDSESGSLDLELRLAPAVHFHSVESASFGNTLQNESTIPPALPEEPTTEDQPHTRPAESKRKRRSYIDKNLPAFADNKDGSDGLNLELGLGNSQPFTSSAVRRYGNAAQAYDNTKRKWHDPLALTLKPHQAMIDDDRTRTPAEEKERDLERNRLGMREYRKKRSKMGPEVVQSDQDRQQMHQKNYMERLHKDPKKLEEYRKRKAMNQQNYSNRKKAMRQVRQFLTQGSKRE